MDFENIKEILVKDITCCVTENCQIYDHGKNENRSKGFNNEDLQALLNNETSESQE